MSKRSILILDDDREICDLFATSFCEVGFKVDTVNCIDDAKLKFEHNSYDVVLADVFLKNEDGLRAIQELIHLNPKTRFFSFTGKESIPLAVKAMELGAAGFFPKTLGYQKIVGLVQSKISTSPDNAQVDFFNRENLIGSSSSMLDVFRQMEQFRKVDSTVLITGESGTGKEVVAKTLHKISQRSQGPFEAINCGAIPENLLESELFGHKRGAFTDAKFDKKGLFEICSTGTLMLDEIGDMPMALQVKLLRVLQEKEIRPIGATHTIKINPRIIACTHRDLDQLVRDGKFRHDLLYRLSILKLSLPPLRHRKEDIPLLVSNFINKFSQRFDRKITQPSSELMVRIKNYPWPGNVRELQNAIERAVVLSQDGHLHLDDLFSEDLDPNHSNIVNMAHLSLEHGQAKKNFERNYLENLLKQSQGNISKAARLSGKHRVEIYRLMNKHDFHREDFISREGL